MPLVVQKIERRQFPRTKILSQESYPFSAYAIQTQQPAQIVGEIIDYSQGGLGIRINSAANAPKKGDHLYCLKFCLPNLQSISKEVGQIRHINFSSDNDRHLLQMGIKFINISQEKVGPAVTTATTRPARFSLEKECIAQTKVRFFLDGETLCGNLLNYSKFGLAIQVPREAPLVLTREKLLKQCEIEVKGKVVSIGNVFIKNFRENSDGVILGCEIAERIIDVDTLQKTLNIYSISANLQPKFLELAQLNKISTEFKSAAADIRYYLENTHKIFEDLGAPDSIPDEIVKDFYPTFSSQLDLIYERLRKSASDIPKADHGLYKSYLQDHTLRLVLQGPFQKHAYIKPYGYAGDYEMVLKILDKEVEGNTPIAKLLNMYGWNMSVVKAHRNRIEYLVKKIDAVVRRNLNARILTIGAGPAREIKLFLERTSLPITCHFTLVDFDPRALVFCQEELRELLFKKKSLTTFEFINKSIRQIIKEKRCDEMDNTYDFIYCAGLFDYLSDPFCKKVLEVMYSQLNQDGFMIATNVFEDNYYRYYMEMMLEWYLTHRKKCDMFNLASELSISANNKVEVEEDLTGVNLFLNVYKQSAFKT